MQVRKIIIALFVIIVLCFLNFCEKVVFEPIEVEIPSTDTNQVCFIINIDTSCYYIDSICLSYVIQPIFNNKCTGCHGGGISPNLSAGVSYNELISGGYIEQDATKPESSLIYQKLLTQPHNSRATDVEKQLILLWIKTGKKESCD